MSPSMPPSSWDRPGTVSGFVSSPPNAVLLEYAERQLRHVAHPIVADIGCGAGRNTIPLARLGTRVIAVDASLPMLEAAIAREDAQQHRKQLCWARGTADQLPIATSTADLVVAHGIWNLARSGEEFRRAVREGARVARPGARLFVFTFSRNTLPTDVAPVAGETFVFTQFSGDPQCFLTESQLIAELAEAGFVRDEDGPITEYNRRSEPVVIVRGPVIYEATFRRQ